MLKSYGVCGACEYASESPLEFEVHEVLPGVPMAFCKPCVDVLELDYGK
jgi:hypothetical protein